MHLHVRTLLIFQLLSMQYIDSRLIAISDEDIDMRESLAKCVASASSVYFKEQEIITVSLGPNMSQATFSLSLSLDAMLLPALFGPQSWSLLLKQPHRGRPNTIRNYLNYHRSDSYILQLRSWQEINMHLNFLRRQPSWNPHAKFIILSATLYENVDRIIEYLIKKLWAQDILNGVVVFPDDTNHKVYNVYTWFPFADGSCGDQFNRIEKITNCTYGKMSNEINWFPDKVPAKMNNCSVRIRTFDYPPFVIKTGKGEHNIYNLSKGLEVKLLNLVSQVANLYMLYEIIPGEKWGEFRQLPNESTGIVGALVRSEADVGIAAMSATLPRHSFLDATSAYFQDSIGFCVPHAEQKSQFAKFAEIMTVETWICVTLTIIVITILTKHLSVFNCNENNAYHTYSSVYQKVIAISIGHAVNIQPRSTQVRTFLMLWIIFSLHLDTAYQTYLMSTLTNIEYEYQIQNIDDILKTDLDLLLLPTTVGYFADDDRRHGPFKIEVEKNRGSYQTQQITARMKYCDNVDDCLRRTAYRRDSVIAASRVYIQYAKNSYLSKTGLPMLYCLEERIVSFPVVVYMRRGFPLLRKFDDIINMLSAGGFVTRFEKDLFREKKFAQESINNTYEEVDILDVTMSFITLDHMRPIFWMLLIGYASCWLALFIEIIIHKYRKAKHSVRS